MRYRLSTLIVMFLMSLSLAFSGTLTVDSTVKGNIKTESYSSEITVLELEQSYLIGLDEDVCKQYGGGMYSINVNPVNLEWHGAFKKGSYSTDFVYCKTTADIINMGAVPISWVNDNLILYCNEGKEIHTSGEVPDLDIISTLNVYKACILKNLDLDSDNTIIFGLYSGNMEKNPAVFSGDQPLLFINALSKIADKEISLDTKYHVGSSFFYISTVAETDFYPLNYIFEANKYGVSGSRAFIAKSFSGQKVVYGYDSSSDFKIKSSNINIGSFTELCNNALARYSSIECGDNFISIPGSNDKTTFNLVKNIIFGLNDATTNSVEATSNSVSSGCLNSGGTPYYENGEFICRFSGSSCKGGFSSAGYTATSGNYGVNMKDSPKTWEEGPGPDNVPWVRGACFTGLHSFSKTNTVESCNAISYGRECEFKGLGLSKDCKNVQVALNQPIKAEVVEVGCR